MCVCDSCDFITVYKDIVSLDFACTHVVCEGVRV